MSIKKLMYPVAAAALLAFQPLHAANTQDARITDTYNKLQKVLALNGDKESLTKLTASQEKWLQQKNKCKDAKCLQSVNKARWDDLEDHWLSAGHGALTYADAMKLSAPFEKAIQQGSVEPLLKRLTFPVMIRHGESDKLFLDKAEFAKYFPSILRDLQKDAHWQLGVAELGAGAAATTPIMTLGHESAHPDKYLYIDGASNIISLPENRKLPAEWKTLEKQHEAMFVPHNSIEGTYVSSNGKVYVRQASATDTQIVLSLMQAHLGMFSGISHDQDKGKMQFVATNSQFQNPVPTPPQGCMMSVKFLPNKMIVDAGNCDNSGFFGHSVSAAGSYMRVSANEPTPAEMSISD